MRDLGPIIALLNNAQQICDEAANWITGDESYSPQTVGDALATLAMECRKAIADLQKTHPQDTTP